MTKILKKIGVVLSALLGIALTSGFLLRLLAQNKTAAKIRIVAPKGISVIERIELGGVEQWIQIRGHDRSKQILLFLHGGPGFPQMPFAHQNAELEEHFVVVHWDQRGAGKSYSWSTPGESMRVAQFVSDTRELTEHLLQRFQQPKCYLVAHSWGSLFGALTAARHPGLFHAYVSIGQLAGLPETQQVRYQFALDSAHKEKNKKAVAELNKIGRPPYDGFDQSEILEKWVNLYSAEEHEPIPPRKFYRLAFSSPAYSWLDLIKMPLGVQVLVREIVARAFLSKQSLRASSAHRRAGLFSRRPA